MEIQEVLWTPGPVIFSSGQAVEDGQQTPFTSCGMLKSHEQAERGVAMRQLQISMAWRLLVVLCAWIAWAAQPAASQVLSLTQRFSFLPLPPITAGGSVTCTLQYTNGGGTVAKDVSLVYFLPPSTTLERNDGSGVYDPAARTITFSLSNLPIQRTGQVSVQFKISASVPHQTALPSRAVLYSAESRPIESVQQITISNSPSVILYQFAESQVQAGEDFSITLSFNNGFSGDNIQPATNVVIKDILPEQARFVSASDGGVYDPAKHVVTWNLGTLGVREIREITLVLRAAYLPPYNFYRNRATLTADPGVSVTKDEGVMVVGVPPEPEVPTLGETGIIAFAALIAAAGLFLVRRRAGLRAPPS